MYWFRAGGVLGALSVTARRKTNPDYCSYVVLIDYVLELMTPLFLLCFLFFCCCQWFGWL